MQEMKNVIDGGDFVTVINATSQGCPVEMEQSDFKMYENDFNSRNLTGFYRVRFRKSSLSGAQP